MNIKYILISGILLVLTMQTLVFALIPPPPVNQVMGVYDTNFANLTEIKCRGCHSSGVPDSHHKLVPTGEYVCMNCHPVVTNPDGSPNITMPRDCLRCHGTTFNGLNIRVPHHETQIAQDRHCSFCHGNIVDDFDDGHYIPEYNVSLVTPDTKYKIINSTTGKKWGGCEACHEADATLTPPVYFNNKTHHRLGSLSGFNPQNVSKCATCHDTHSSQYGPDFIRYCERCHATRSLHNIQYDYANTSSKSGYGHIGNNWDCNGCHAWYVAGATAPGTDVIVPTIAALGTGRVYEGETTLLTIHGKDLVTSVNGVTHSSVVVITNGTGTNVLTPGSITPDNIVVTVPALNRGAYGIYALKNGNVKSNRLPVTAIPKVIIKSVRKNGSNLEISGSGFGPYDPAYKDFVNITVTLVKKGTVKYRTVEINGWSDTLIRVISGDTAAGDTAMVNSIYGTSSAKVIKYRGGGKTGG